MFTCNNGERQGLRYEYILEINAHEFRIQLYPKPPSQGNRIEERLGEYSLQ